MPNQKETSKESPEYISSIVLTRELFAEVYASSIAWDLEHSKADKAIKERHAVSQPKKCKLSR